MKLLSTLRFIRPVSYGFFVPGLALCLALSSALAQMAEVADDANPTLNVEEPAEAEINESPIVNEQSEDTISYALTGQKLTIAGDNNTVTVRGETPAVIITGSGNTVQIQAVDRIEIAGGNNTVTWSAAVSLDLPQIVNEGQGNTISPGQIE